MIYYNDLILIALYIVPYNYVYAVFLNKRCHGHLTLDHHELVFEYSLQQFPRPSIFAIKMKLSANKLCLCIFHYQQRITTLIGSHFSSTSLRADYLWCMHEGQGPSICVQTIIKTTQEK